MKNFFKQIKTPTKEKKKLPKSTKSSKPLRFMLWALLLILVVSAPLSIIRSQNALESTRATSQKVTEMQDSNEVEANPYTSEQLEVYAKRVIDRFINIPSSSEDRKAALETLDSYYATGVPLPEWGDFRGYRTINSKELYDIERQEERAVVHYRIDFTSTVIEEREETEVRTEENDDGDEEEIEETITVEDETEVNKTALMSVPITAVEDGGYMVIDNPYMSPLPDINGSGAEKNENPLESESQVSVDEKEEVESFLNEFFSEYASGTAEDMTYMMDEPEALNGILDFGEIVESNVYADDGDYTVKATVAFKDPDINVTQREDFSLTIRSEQNRFFIEEINNTFGGH